MWLERAAARVTQAVMFTIDEIKEIAKRANESIVKDFTESGFKKPPPLVTYGMVRAVLEASQAIAKTTQAESPSGQATKQKESK